ncbi:PTS sugar transporter subunit IIA [Tetragenococcus halophilus]|uniref:Phosphotransferase system enzyme IIA component n=1 Tax=Tetragenococcus halophilus (strain DSM 20338 / JCM 20259 / NCIMB 9735 / NBRC 12172) TaxID=945021 RepID=A0AAN1SF82_TETHN|nr:PTS sugar transporter subunit IIA [Tetragenococcus halophilus]NRR74934.1 PTS sugar transporter subunit IIA [Tetragenococcus halophilus]QXN86503.1 PTS sugar transporter subunit IIA [Tetragenococcus halophilus]BAK93938.1 putative phosphotransferase system enzyme IIA component [Tetragenococcus halophilus NBRC 12172]GBD59179.1 putative phosphotransferase system enzyme IIA component [Tetragenococcus halophilus subsp. halophilus]GBD61001.1 putative phosphotransferase system enzyme IIA component [
MKDDQLFHIYPKKGFSSKEEVLAFLGRKSQQLVGISVTEFKNQLLKREKQGSIEIAPGVLLPHFESASFTQSKVFVLSLKSEVEDWNQEIHKTKLVIVILLKAEEEKAIKQEIAAFTRKLADDNFLDELMN